MQPDATYGAGDIVTWTLTPHNDGPRAAPAGWTITQLLPDGRRTRLDDGRRIHGRRYDGDGCRPRLAAGDDGPALTVTVRIVVAPAGRSTMRDVAYVAPAPDTRPRRRRLRRRHRGDVGPLVVPTLATDTDASPTDNDAQGVWMTNAVSPPVPATGGDTGQSIGGLPGTGSSVLPGLITGTGSASARCRSDRGRPHPSVRWMTYRFAASGLDEPGA